MEKITILNNQSLLDLSIQLTGNANNAFELGKVNNIAVTEELIAGDTIYMPEEMELNPMILKYYKLNKVIPASALTQENRDVITGCEGIGCWVIEFDFKVS